MDRFKKVLKFIGLIFLLLLINIFPMRLIGFQERTPVYLQWLLSIVYLVVASLLIHQTWKKYKSTEPQSMKSLRFTWKDFGIAFLFFIATRVVAVLGTQLIQFVLGNATSASDAALMATADQVKQIFPLYVIAFHVAIGLYAPVMEELVFRGFFSHYFFKPENKGLKLIISSTIFALLHIVYPIEFVLYFGMGAIFYLAFARRGNVKDAIAVHLLNNSLMVLFSIINYIILILG